MRLTRRRMMQSGGAAGLGGALPFALGAAERDWPLELGPDTPKICVGGGGDPDRLRHLKQIGVDYVMAGLGNGTEQAIRETMERHKAAGITVINMMFGGIEDVIRGGPNRDKEIERVIGIIRAAGRAGLPVLEYNFYAHRIVEGYYEELGRGGAGYTAFSHDKVKDLPPLEREGVHTREEQFKRAEHFLKAVIPEAEKANVRLALHPNDPPAPMSRGSEQIMATFEHWKRYLDLVKSPYNGITYDCGVTREMGEDPVEVLRYLGSRDVINHAHFRNVVVRKPYVDYAEVFNDTGQVNMFAVMKELVRQKYSRGLNPEHPRALDMDRKANAIRGQYAKVGGGGPVGEVYNVAFTKAMLLAALSG